MAEKKAVATKKPTPVKRNEQNKKRWMRNKSVKSALRTEIKKFLAQLQDPKVESSQLQSNRWHRTIDKAYSKGVLTKNSASRSKSKLDTMLNERQNKSS